jgi:hypothetical protein
VIYIGKRISDEIIIAALITSPTIKAAAEMAKIGETTLHNRLNNPAFQRKYRAACVDLVKDHAATMQIAMGEAIGTLREIIKDKSNASGVRASAADTILRNGLKLTEQADFLERLEALEAEKDRQ